MVISKRYLILFLSSSLLFLLLLFLNEQLIEFVTLGVILNILAIYIFDNSSTGIVDNVETPNMVPNSLDAFATALSPS